jgi:hypothetical protein
MALFAAVVATYLGRLQMLDNAFSSWPTRQADLVICAEVHPNLIALMSLLFYNLKRVVSVFSRSFYAYRELSVMTRGWSSPAPSGPNLTFRFAWGFSGRFACASLRNARANQHSIECRRPQGA